MSFVHESNTLKCLAERRREGERGERWRVRRERGVGGREGRDRGEGGGGGRKRELAPNAQSHAEMMRAKPNASI